MESAKIHLRAAQEEDAIAGASAGTARRNMNVMRNNRDLTEGGI